LGLDKGLILHINTLGLPEERQEYQAVLVEYFEKNFEALDEDSQRRLKKNALRILDSKNPAMKSLLDNAPSIETFMGTESKYHFETIQHAVKKAGIPFQVNPRLVRGLDYYCHTVFEWVTDALGAQGAVCAGGRYDKLVEQMGGDSTPAVGFAMGMERLILLLQQQNLALENKVDVYLMSVGESARAEALFLAETLRAALPSLRIVNYCGAGNIKAQFKKADKSGAKLALILGDEEMAQGVVTLKYLREDKPQLSVVRDQLINFLS
jgi:histidyl-tRNA synthetase